MIAIFDLDGTLALNEHRQHFLEEKPKNWKAFEDACTDDKPNIPLIKLAQKLWNNGKGFLFICSGRSEDVRVKTEYWLHYARIEYTHLYMRKSNDYRDDREVKKEMFEEIEKRLSNLFPPNRQFDFIIFDDRQKVVDMWREMGLVCCQVAPGDF